MPPPWLTISEVVPGAGLAHAAQQHRHLGCLAPGDVVIPEPGTKQSFGVTHVWNISLYDQDDIDP